MRIGDRLTLTDPAGEEVAGRLAHVVVTPAEVVHTHEGPSRVLSWSIGLELEVSTPLPPALHELLTDDEEDPGAT